MNASRAGPQADPNPGITEHATTRQYDRSARLRRRAYAKVDRFAPFTIGKDCMLPALDRWILLTLALLCDYKTGDCPTTLTDLASDTGADWRAVKASVERLAAANLIQVVVPFRQKAQGLLRVLALDQLLVDAKPVLPARPPERPAPHLLPRARKSADTSDSAVRANPAPIPRQSDANPAHNPRLREIAPYATSDDADAQGSAEGRGEGSARESRDHELAVALLERELGAEVVGERVR